MVTLAKLVSPIVYGILQLNTENKVTLDRLVCPLFEHITILCTENKGNPSQDNKPLCVCRSGTI